MRFLNITTPRNITTNKLLEDACAKRNIEYVAVSALNALQSEELAQPFLLYRTSVESLSRYLEKQLLMLPTAVSFRNPAGSPLIPDNVIEATLIHQQHHVPMPRTVIISTSDPAYLDDAVKKVGGYPVVAKVPGGSHGVGVMFIDSKRALTSISDYLLQQNQPFLLRQYVNVNFSARLVVLGSKVIDSIAYETRESEFRSNVGSKPQVVARGFSPDIQDIAVKATNCLGYEFGGVDVLIDADGKAYLTEVNLPCFFPRCQQLTGTDIAGKMIDHLNKKALSTFTKS